MAGKGKRVEAIGYMRTSSATNVGDDKDSERRQRAAIEGYAKRAGMVVVEWFYDGAVNGADPIEKPPRLRRSTHPDRRQWRVNYPRRDRQPLRPRPDGARGRLRHVARSRNHAGRSRQPYRISR